METHCTTVNPSDKTTGLVNQRINTQNLDCRLVRDNTVEVDI